MVTVVTMVTINFLCWNVVAMGGGPWDRWQWGGKFIVTIVMTVTRHQFPH